MIDTLVITLSNEMFILTDPARFTPSAQWVLDDRIQRPFGMVSKQNPTTKDLRNGVYKPRLTIAQRIHAQRRPEIMLKIDLSLPKLMFGNNFQELQYKDFSALVQRLALVLRDMGVATTAEILAAAPVSAIHYAKNMLLTDGSTPYHYISKIKEANVSLALDINQTDYRNDGHCYKWHANAYEVVFYDKIRDLEKAYGSDKRALEKDNAIQFDLHTAFKNRHKVEVLRMEVRLNKRKKIRQLFDVLDIKVDLTFKKLFKPAIAKKVLLYYMDEIYNKRLAVLDHTSTNPKSFLRTLILNNPHMSPRRIVQIFGLQQALGLFAPRELRTMFAQSSAQSWTRLVTDLKTIKLPLSNNPLEGIREQLVQSKALKKPF